MGLIPANPSGGAATGEEDCLNATPLQESAGSGGTDGRQTGRKEKSWDQEGGRGSSAGRGHRKSEEAVTEEEEEEKRPTVTESKTAGNFTSQGKENNLHLLLPW